MKDLGSFSGFGSKTYGFKKTRFLVIEEDSSDEKSVSDLSQQDPDVDVKPKAPLGSLHNRLGTFRHANSFESEQEKNAAMLMMHATRANIEQNL